MNPAGRKRTQSLSPHLSFWTKIFRICFPKELIISSHLIHTKNFFSFPLFYLPILQNLKANYSLKGIRHHQSAAKLKCILFIVILATLSSVWASSQNHLTRHGFVSNCKMFGACGFIFMWLPSLRNALLSKHCKASQPCYIIFLWPPTPDSGSK